MKSQIYRLWEKGIPTADAPLKFLHPSQFPEGTTKEQLLTSNYTLANLLEIMGAEAESGGLSGFDAFQAASQKLMQLEKPRTEMIDRGKSVLLKALRSGEMKAFAFEKPRSVKDDAVELEASTFAGIPRLLWDFGKLRHQGLEFIEVRMLHEKTAKQWISRWRDEAGIGARMITDTAVRPVGRPTTKHFIVEAYTSLNSANKLDFSKSLTAHYPVIRQWLALNCSSVETADGKPSNEAIRRAVGDQYKAQKAKTKKL